MKKKFIRILLAVLLTVGIFPALTSTAKADDVVLHYVAVGYDTKAVALRPDMMEREVSDLFKESLETTSLLPGTHYDPNCCYLVYKDESGHYWSLDYSNDLISSEREYYFVFNVEEDSGYCWDVDQLPSAMVNGDPADDVQWYSNDPQSNASIDVYTRVYVSENANYVSDVAIEPYRIKIQKGKNKTVSAVVEGTVDTVNWTMYNYTSSNSRVTSAGRIYVGSDETSETLIVRATSTYNPYKYAEIEVIVSDEPVYISSIIITPNPGYVVAGKYLTLEGTIEGTELNDFTWKLIGDHNASTRLTGNHTNASLYVDKDETETTLTVQCTSLHDPSTYKIVSVFVSWPQVITNVDISFDTSGLPLDTSHTGYDVSDALDTALRSASISESIHLDLNCCHLAYLSSGAYYQEYGSMLDAEKEYYLVLNLEENEDYMWDVNNFPNVTVNGNSPDHIAWYGGNDPAADGSIDLYIRVYLDEQLPDAYVHFDKNGGSGYMSDVPVKIGRTYPIPECTFTGPSGYLFDYWQCSAFPGEELRPGNTVTISGDITLKAIWRKGTYSAVIHPIPKAVTAPGYMGYYYIGDIEVENTGDFALSCNSASFYVTDTDHFSVYFASVPGVIPVGGSTSTIGLRAKNNLGPGTYTTQLCFREQYDNMPVISIDVTFIVHRNTEVAVHFDNKGIGEPIEPIILPKGIEFKDAYKRDDWPHPQPDGYTLEGWYYDSACTDFPYPDETISNDLTLYANWYHCPEHFNFNLYRGDPEVGDYTYDFLGVAAEDEHIRVPYACWNTYDGETMTEYEGPFENGRTYYLMVKLHATPDEYMFEYNANIDWLRYKEITLNGRDISYSTVRRYDSDKHFLYLYLPYTASNAPQLILKKMSTLGIEMSWTSVYGFSSYDLYRDGVKIATVNGTSYLDDVGRTMGTWYGYKVIGNDDGNYSGFSELEEVLFNPFVDIAYVSDDFERVAWAYNNSIVNGISTPEKNLFGPLNPCTRAQFCIMLYKMNGMPPVTLPSTLPFSDISDQTSNTKKAIVWCANQGIIEGKNGKFNPKGNITRSQLAIMLYKMAGKPNVSISDLHFTDIASQTSNTKKAIVWCYQNHMIDSISGSLFEPAVNGSRALLTEMLYGYAHR